MSKEVEILVESARNINRNKQNKRKENPMGSLNAQKLLQEDIRKNPEAVLSTTQALIDEGFLPARQLLDTGFLDDDLYECLTRLDKKDSATKLKALNDFMELINTKESDRMASTRTFWARLFLSFMEDEDLRIREMALKCQEAYVKSLKKEFLPILKTVMGSWWLAQFQMHSGVAATAKSSFTAAFSEQKRPDVLKLASREICMLLRRRILLKSLKGKTGTESARNDEQEQRIAEALDAFHGFLVSVKEDALSDVHTFVIEILDSPEFWKSSKLENPRVRQQFFILLRTLWERMPNALSSYLKPSIAAIVGNLHDRDVRAAVATWDFLLYLLNSHPEWINFIDVQKVFIPKLVAFLRHAGFGTASSTYPSIIVILDKLPSKSQETVDQILSALIHGATNESVRVSDISSVFRAICDIFNYSVKKLEFAEQLVEKHLIPLLKDVLFGTGNSIRGTEIVFGMIFKWMKKEIGEPSRSLADLIWKELAAKMCYSTMDVSGVVRTQQWMIGLTGVESKSVLYGMIEKHPGFQDFLFHALRLSYQYFQSSENPEDGKSLLTFLRSNRSDVLYRRLADHLSSEPLSPDVSPQAVILSKFPVLQNNPIHLELFSLLLEDCKSESEAREIFGSVWKDFSEKVDLLQAVEKYCGNQNFGRFISDVQLQDLVQMAQNFSPLSKFGDVIELLNKFQVPFDALGNEIIEKIRDYPIRKQIAVMEILFSKGNPGQILKGNVESIIILALKLAREPESLDANGKLKNDIVERLKNLGKFVIREDMSWGDKVLADFRENGLNTKSSSGVIQNTAVAIISLFAGSNLPGAVISDHMSQICDSLDLPSLSGRILERKDVFLCRINNMDIFDELKLTNPFFDDEIRYFGNTCIFLNTILADKLGGSIGSGRKEKIEELGRLMFSYLKLSVDGIVQEPGSLAEVNFYLENLKPSSNYSSSPSFVETLRSIGDTDIWSDSSSSELLVDSVHDLSEDELITAYSGLWSQGLEIPQPLGIYRNDIRDRLEILVAFSEFPRTCAAINTTPWNRIQLIRLAPSLLSERCVDLQYTGPVLDVFGTVVIDWISCLQDPLVLEENPKVLVLIEEALESVGNIIKAKDLLKDAGILWIELTEFSFPRILASMLGGLFMISDANANMALSKRHPLFIKLVLKLCAVICDFAAESQNSLKIVWETMYKLESGLPARLAIFNSMPTEMSAVFIRLFAPLLLHKFHHFQIIAAEVLHNLLPSFPPTYKVEVSTDEENAVKSEALLAPPVELLSLLEETGEIVEALMDQVPLEESFGDVIPETDSYTYLLGYLMTWRSTFSWIKNESLEARQVFSAYLDSNGTFTNLLDCLTRFLPLYDSSSSDVNTENHNASLKFIHREYPSLLDFESFAEEVYSEALEIMPNLARSWFGRKQGSLGRELAKFTAVHISPELIKSELAAASAQAKFMTTDSFKVNVRPAIFEITAEYKVEVWVAEIVIKIPKDYPLGNVQVFWGSTKGNAMDAWDQWIIRLSAHLRKRNGTILDGVLEWKKTVDKKFRDTAACSICLSIVDTKTSEVPKMQCKTCRNKFHSECLNRWFREQIDPTCPLCREKFFA